MQELKLVDYYVRQVVPKDTPWLEKYIAWNDAKKARMDHEGSLPIVMTMRDREKPREIKVRDRGLYSACFCLPLPASSHLSPRARSEYARWRGKCKW